MKKQESVLNQSYSPELAKHFSHLSMELLRLYKKYGESTECIDSIQNEIQKYYHSKLIKQRTIQKIIGAQQQGTQYKNQHSVYRIVDNENLKVALHITTSGIKIPLHSHPQSLNSLLVIRGTLKVKQYSFHKLRTRTKSTLLHSNTCCSGLAKQYNTHSIEATGLFNAFLSIRYKLPKYTFRKPRTSPLVALAVSLMASLNSYAYPSFNKISALTTPYQSSQNMNVDTDNQLVIYANKLRQLDEEAQYDAAKLYLQAANNNNPEAQYWLGYMHLQGMGITEDDDEALKWISAAARQEYPPATALLNHILYTEVASDC